MADETKTKQSAAHGPDLSSPAFQAAILDVIVRGLDVAKQGPEGLSHEDLTKGFCAFCYAEPGNFCFIGYAHKQ